MHEKKKKKLGRFRAGRTLLQIEVIEKSDDLFERGVHNSTPYPVPSV